MTISVTMDVSQTRGSKTFDLEDLGIKDEAEWDNMSVNDKRSALQVAIDNLHNQPYWILDNFEEII